MLLRQCPKGFHFCEIFYVGIDWSYIWVVEMPTFEKPKEKKACLPKLNFSQP